MFVCATTVGTVLLLLSAVKDYAQLMQVLRSKHNLHHSVHLTGRDCCDAGKSIHALVQSQSETYPVCHWPALNVPQANGGIIRPTDQVTFHERTPRKAIALCFVTSQPHVRIASAICGL